MSSIGTGSIGRRMDQAVDAVRRDLGALRTGRANPELVTRVVIDAWGQRIPLEQVAQVGVQPPRGLVVTPHDPSLLGAIERALGDADLGGRPRVDGMRIRIDLPEPTAERRVELARKARDVAESGRVAVRGVRRDAINELKRRRKADEVSEAKLHGRSKDIQVLTDEHVAQVDELLASAMRELEL